jgi:hypothetical protein
MSIVSGGDVFEFKNFSRGHIILISQIHPFFNYNPGKCSVLEKFDTQFMFRLPVRELTGIQLTSLKFQTHYAKPPG